MSLMVLFRLYCCRLRLTSLSTRNVITSYSIHYTKLYEAEGPSTISGIDRYLTRKGVNLSSASRILKTLHQCNILSESESRYAVAPA